MKDGKPDYNGDDITGGQVYPDRYMLLRPAVDPYHEMKLMHKIANIEPIDSPRDQITGAPTKTQVDKGESLELTNETYLKIIYGKVPINNLDDYVSKWKSLGGDQLTKEINDWFKSVSGK
jgi:hypothetical protein